MAGAVAPANHPALELAAREATGADAEAIFRFLIPMAHEWSIFPVAPGKAAKAIFEFFNGTEAKSNWAVVILAGDEIVASAGFTLQDGWFFDELFLGEMWFYAAPDARASGAAKLLEKTCREFSDRCGLPMLVPIMHVDRVKLKSEFLRRRGWSFMGGVMGYGFGETVPS